jgi:hypothetical protein
MIAGIKNTELPSIDNIIEYLENTTEESWCLDVVKTKEGGNCLFGHLFDMGGSRLMDLFEDQFATTFMVYPVNDGTNPKYQQSTPKQRCLAYVKDLKSGVAQTTQDIYKEYDEEIRNEKNV